MMEIKLGDLAKLIDANLLGDSEIIISGVATLEKASPDKLSFYSNKQYRKYLSSTKAAAVILTEADLPNCKTNALVTNNPRLALVKVVQLFAPADLSCGIHPSATVAENAILGPGVYIGPNVVVGAGCVIGANTVLKPNVVLYDNVKIGSDCLIHSGAVIGSDGFGFALENNSWVKMPHIGGVLIGNKVEIGANTSIDRGVLEDTVIGDNVIIDNLVQIGHNVIIGSHTAIAGCVAIAGSTNIGQRCLIGGGACIAGHLSIVDDVHITATSAVNRSLHSAGVYSSGLPARPNEQWRRNVARFQFLDDMYKRIRALEASQREG